MKAATLAICMAIAPLAACSGDRTAEVSASKASPARDRCQELATVQRAHALAPEVLRQTGNVGNDVSATVRECRHFAGEDAVLLSLQVNWTGPLTGAPYALAGRMTLTGDRWQWATTSKSAELRELEAGLAVANAFLRALSQ